MMDKNGFKSIIDFLQKGASEMQNEVTILVNKFEFKNAPLITM